MNKIYTAEFEQYCICNNIEMNDRDFYLWQSAQKSIHSWYSWQSGEPEYKGVQILIELKSGDYAAGFWSKWKSKRDRIFRWRHI